MGLTKRIVPVNARRALAKQLDRLPEGPLRDNFANLVTLNGLCMVAAGASMGGKKGAIISALGELHDDVDGDTARHLNTVDRRGAFIDAGADKAKVAIEMARLFASTANLSDGERPVRRLALGLIATKHLVNSALNVSATARGLNAETSRAGKINMWVDGTAMAAFRLSDAIKDPQASQAFAAIGYAATAVGVPIGVHTAAGYIRETIIHPQPLEQSEPTLIALESTAEQSGL